MLLAERRNPKVIGGNRLSSPSQLTVDSRVMMRRLLSDVQHDTVLDQPVQPLPVSGLMPRLGNPIAIFPYDHYRERYLLSATQNSHHARMFLCGSGKRVRVQDQPRLSEPQISGSTTSNASSIALLIPSVSLCRSFSLPMCFIHGFWSAAGAVFNLSSTASVTNCRSGMPCSAAFDFARRKIRSGISNVVFMAPIFPYLWDSRQSRLVRPCPQANRIVRLQGIALARRPRRISTAATMIVVPTKRKPIVTTLSCHACPLCPAPVMGESAAVPKTAASVVTNQFPYVPQSAVQYAIAFVGEESRTSFQPAPSASRNVPFITPSRCAASPIRMLEKCCSIKPVSRPIRNKNIPCHIKRRFVYSIWLLFSLIHLSKVAPGPVWLACGDTLTAHSQVCKVPVRVLSEWVELAACELICPPSSLIV